MTTVPEERWRKARRSANTDNCVEVSDRGRVRDSKNPAGGQLPCAGLVLWAKGCPTRQP